MTGETGGADTRRPGLMRVQALIVAGRPEQALLELATIPADLASHPTTFGLRASALAALERWPESAGAARAGLAAGGPHPALLGLLAWALHELADLSGAERALLDGLVLAPNDVDLLCRYSRLCTDAGQLDKAQHLIERAAAEAPEAATVYGARIGLAYARGDDREAQRLSRDFLAAHPDDPAAHAAFGGIAAARGQVRAAYAGLGQAAARAPATREVGEAALEAKIAAHPLLVPLRLVFRFGPLKVWLAGVVIIIGGTLLGLPDPLLAGIIIVWVSFVAYSWIVPPLVRWWIRRRWR